MIAFRSLVTNYTQIMQRFIARLVISVKHLRDGQSWSLASAGETCNSRHHARAALKSLQSGTLPHRASEFSSWWFQWPARASPSPWTNRHSARRDSVFSDFFFSLPFARLSFALRKESAIDRNHRLLVISVWSDRSFLHLWRFDGKKPYKYWCLIILTIKTCLTLFWYFLLGIELFLIFIDKKTIFLFLLRSI